jgi:hypothetical protein
MPEVLATLSPSPARRLLALGLLLALGAILLWVALAQPPAAPGWRLFLLLLGGLVLALAEAMRRATRGRIELTDVGLSETGGRMLAVIEDIAAVERGLFAVKPTAGFLVRLRRPAPAAWAPGLWWRVGRSLGIGGVTGRAEARAMAEILQARLAARDRAGAG